MKYLSLIAITTLFACDQTRSKTDRAGYDVITEKSYIIRNNPPAADSLETTLQARQQALITILEKNSFKAHPLKSDSLLFRRDNGLEVEIALPAASDAYGKYTIIAFDPKKNPLFISLHKGTSQLDQYISTK